jgi:hypothetical protein
MLRLYRVQSRLAAAGDDDLVAEFEKFERESEPDPGGPAGDQDGAASESHVLPPGESEA